MVMSAAGRRITSLERHSTSTRATAHHKHATHENSPGNFQRTCVINLGKRQRQCEQGHVSLRAVLTSLMTSSLQRWNART